MYARGEGLKTPDKDARSARRRRRGGSRCPALAVGTEGWDRVGRRPPGATGIPRWTPVLYEGIVTTLPTVPCMVPSSRASLSSVGVRTLGSVSVSQ